MIVAANSADLHPRAMDKPFLWQRSDNYEFATQVVVQTDIALTTVTAADGLHVFARSLGTAGPLSGIEVQLLRDGNAQRPEQHPGHVAKVEIEKGGE